MSEAQVQTQEPPARRLLKEISARINMLVKAEEKSRKVVEVAREILGKECNPIINYETGETWCWERIDQFEELVRQIYQFLKATPPGPWNPRIAIKITTTPITQLDDISEYADKERVEQLFGRYYGIEYEDSGEYEIYVPIETRRSDVYAYLVICIEREDP